jgi:hypothetical protein
MKAALAVQDVGAAVRYFDPRTRDRYNTIFNPILDQLPQVAADMQDIQMIIAEYNYAKYRIRKNETLSGIEPIAISTEGGKVRAMPSSINDSISLDTGFQMTTVRNGRNAFFPRKSNLKPSRNSQLKCFAI